MKNHWRSLLISHIQGTKQPKCHTIVQSISLQHPSSSYFTIGYPIGLSKLSAEFFVGDQMAVSYSELCGHITRIRPCFSLNHLQCLCQNKIKPKSFKLRQNDRTALEEMYSPIYSMYGYVSLELLYFVNLTGSCSLIPETGWICFTQDRHACCLLARFNTMLNPQS